MTEPKSPGIVRRTAPAVAATGLAGFIYAIVAGISPTLVTMPLEAYGGTYQYVTLPHRVCNGPEVQDIADELGINLAGRGEQCSQVFTQTRFMKCRGDCDQAWHTVSTGKQCTEPFARELTLESYYVPVRAQVISEGGQIAFAQCITQGGFYKWVLWIRRGLGR